MKMIGRKIYFDIQTGEKILDTGEREGAVFSTTIEQDITAFTALSERNRETFDVLELSFGEFQQDFAECIGYKINVETKTLEFSYLDPNEPEVPQDYLVPLSVEIEQLKKENTLLKEQLKVNSDKVDLQEIVISDIISTINM